MHIPTDSECQMLYRSCGYLLWIRYFICRELVMTIFVGVEVGGALKWHFASVPYSQMNAACDRMLDEQENVQLIEHATLSILTHFYRFG